MDDLQALAAHLVTLTSPAKASGLPRFRWLDGMSWPKVTGGRSPRTWVFPSGRVCGHRVPRDPSARPDLSDPATLGCLPALAEEAWGMKLCAYRCRAGGWCVESAEDAGKAMATDTNASSRAHAWVAALEAAP